MFQSVYDKPCAIASSEWSPLLWQLSSWGIEADLHVGFGDPAEETVWVAEHVRADLIVMAERSMGSLTRLFKKNPADEVRRRTSIPVLAVRA